MAEDRRDPGGFSLRRWSRRKLDAARSAEQERRTEGSRGTAPLRQDSALPIGRPVEGASEAANAVRRAADTGASSAQHREPENPPTAAATPTRPGQTATPNATNPLPSVESLTLESDFAPFMRSGVDADLKRSALRKLFRDPHFNVMDGLDVYIDDYSKPSPIEPEIARSLMQARYIFDPPKTRVNADGFVEDVPAETPTPLTDGGQPQDAVSSGGRPGTIQADGPRSGAPATPRMQSAPGALAAEPASPVEDGAPPADPSKRS